MQEATGHVAIELVEVAGDLATGLEVEGALQAQDNLACTAKTL